MKRYRVLWTHEAFNDLEEIVTYIAAESQNAAWRMFKKLKEAASKLKTQPERCRVVPELAEHGLHGIRELIWTPHRVMFRVNEGTVYVLAVLDGRRDIEDLLFSRFIRISKGKRR